MNSERIEEIQKQTAYPESQSVFTALHQVWNEVGQEYQAEIRQLEARVARMRYQLLGYRNELIAAEQIYRANKSSHNATATEQRVRLDEFRLKIRAIDEVIKEPDQEHANQLPHQADKG